MNDTSTIISVENALAILLKQVKLMQTEQVSLLSALDRTLAKDAVSDIDISPFSNSAMDGFAVLTSDFERINPSKDKPLTLAIVGLTGAGDVFEAPLLPGQALRIMTGAPIPKGADAVVKLEDVAVSGQGESCPQGEAVSFFATPTLGENIRPAGEEASAGDTVLKAGQRLKPTAIGLLASTGHSTVEVYKQPRVAIIATGNELVDIDQKPCAGQIRNSNSYELAAQLTSTGCLPYIVPHINDTYEALALAIKDACSSHDFVITSGGAAGGDFDFVTPVVNDLGTLFFNKVNMRPGKAQTFGLVNNTLVFGLPGNPAAAAVGFEILIRPALLKMQGVLKIKRTLMQAICTKDIQKKPELRRIYLRATLEKTANGSYSVTPNAKQSSAVLGAMAHSNCLLVMPEGDKPIAAGDLAYCLRLDMEEGCA